MAQKKKLSAKEIVADIRAGMSDSDLMKKYELSEKGNLQLLQKLVDAGHITQEEVNERSSDEVDLEMDVEEPRIHKPAPTVDRRSKDMSTPAKSTQTESSVPWYDRTFILVLLLLFFPPLVFYGIYRNSKLSENFKVLLGLFAGLLCISGIWGGMLFVWGIGALSVILWIAYQRVPASRPAKVAVLGVAGFFGLLFWVVIAKDVLGILPESAPRRPSTHVASGSKLSPVPQQEPKDELEREERAIPESRNLRVKGKSATSEAPPPVRFPVTFEKGEPQGTRQFLAKILRASIIAGKDPATLDYCGRVTVHDNCFEKTLEQVLKAESQCERTKSKKSGMVECPDANFLRRALSGMWADMLRRTVNPHKHELQVLREDLRHAGVIKYKVACLGAVRDLRRFAESVMAQALPERKKYWAAVKKREAIIQAKREEAYKRYVQEIRSGKRPVKSFEDAEIKFASVDGTEYVDRPPTSVPDDNRYLHFSGTIETQEGDTVICNEESFYGGDEFKIRKWAFRSSAISSYVPRINERVTVIGKISDVLKGSTVIGKTIYMVVVDAVAIEDGERFYLR